MEENVGAALQQPPAATRRPRAFGQVRWDLALFGLGVLALAFAGGVAAATYRLFPYGVLQRADDAVQDWRANWRHYLQIRSRYLHPTTRTAGGVTVDDAAAV